MTIEESGKESGDSMESGTMDSRSSESMDSIGDSMESGTMASRSTESAATSSDSCPTSCAATVSTESGAAISLDSMTWASGKPAGGEREWPRRASETSGSAQMACGASF